MKRFYFGENEDDEDEDEDEDDQEQGEMENFIRGPEMFSMAQFPIDTFGPNGTLDAAIKICENSFFWKFYKLQTKLIKIKETYLFLIKLEDEIIDEQKER